jgi:hypothetical protein
VKEVPSLAPFSDDDDLSDGDPNATGDEWNLRWAEMVQALKSSFESERSRNEEDWNSRYQHLQDIACQTPPTQRQRAKKLRELMAAFKTKAAREVRAFVAENDNNQKKQMFRISAGISLYRLEDPGAVQTANQELRILTALNSLELSGIHTPLAAVLQYAGVVVYARAPLPETASVDIAGQPRHEPIRRLLQLFSQHFNIRVQSGILPNSVKNSSESTRSTLKSNVAEDSDRDSGSEQYSEFEEELDDPAANGEQALRNEASEKLPRSNMVVGSVAVGYSDIDDRFYLTDALRRKFNCILLDEESHSLRKVMLSRTHQALQLQRRVLTELGVEPLADLDSVAKTIASVEFESTEDSEFGSLSERSFSAIEKCLVGIVRLKLVGTVHTKISFELHQDREYHWLAKRREVLGVQHPSLAPILRRLLHLYSCWRFSRPGKYRSHIASRTSPLCFDNRTLCSGINGRFGPSFCFASEAQTIAQQSHR